jgi:AcrR family transcriptional regulator
MCSQPDTSSHPPGRSLGRPRDHATDDAILRATVELLATGGLEATSIRAVSERSGAARASIYLRWPNRDALISAALRHAIGREPHRLSGVIATDLQRGAEQTRAILAQPLFAAVMPALIRELIGDDPARDRWATYDALFPNRARFADEYDRLAADQGYRTDVDRDLPADIVIGAFFSRLVATGRAPSARFGREVVDLVLAGLRAAPEATTARR